MNSIIREKILSQLAIVGRLVDLYQQKDARFAVSVIDWVEQTETELAPFRLPLVSELSGLRGMMAATADGYVEPSVAQTNSRSTRKQISATYMVLLQQAEQRLREKVLTIDAELDEYRDKLSQVLAVASEQQPLPAPDVMSTQYLDQLWHQVSASQSNKTLVLYLQARMSETDRRYLLQDLVGHLLGQVSAQA
ncbi:hypothetical protein [Reinekea blandensis]|uniref:Uncharacterized protein n=1 Tax=Reinekea blandensis MED297 TaxID=314283 RepID=A4BCY8_9GAMM|nr:hypothetical protein [Reinekea blandensis]EAR10070.1 hypothetical protein MED297_08276 [Reinekea sp. MED297] [Reinekea blandensis MED297]